MSAVRARPSSGPNGSAKPTQKTSSTGSRASASHGPAAAPPQSRKPSALLDAKGG